MINAFTQLPFEYQEYLAPLEREELTSIAALKVEVQDYLKELDDAISSFEFLDITTAKNVGSTCLELLDHVGPNPSKKNHRVLQMAIRYFILDEDAEGDVSSIIGFDDDAEVVRAAKSFITS